MRIAILFLLVLHPLAFEKILEKPSLQDQVCRSLVYLCGGSFFASLSALGHVGLGLCHLLPQKAISTNEFSLFNDLCSQSMRIAFKGPCKSDNWQQTWKLNQELLTCAPRFSEEDDRLVHFLQERWLAKVAGISQISLNWVYPCFGFTIQSNPASNHAYARLVSSHMTSVYKERMEAWKRELGTQDPLILTRSIDVGAFLPSYILVEKGQALETIVQKIRGKAIVDFTDCLSAQHSGWKENFSHLCSRQGLNLDEVICIERVEGDHIGGIRILPLPCHSFHTLSKQHDYLLESISTLGLVANRIELDRGHKRSVLEDKPSFSIHRPDKKEFLSLLEFFEITCRELPEYKRVLIDGTLGVIKGLFNDMSEQKWQKVLESPTKSFITWLSMVKIKNQLELLSKHLNSSLFEIASQLEQVHADFSALLEVLRPFSASDFPQIYRDLIAIPVSLTQLTSYGIHNSGMICFASILKAVQKKSGSVHAIYGENSYFECTKALEKLADSFSLSDCATQQEWKRANLLLVQYNPAISIDPKHEQYQLENIEAMVRKSLNARAGASLTLALDGTLDSITSPKVTHILTTFSQEILEGTLAVVVFRTGNKFDLLGMDNYCGAPFFVISSDLASFDLLFTEPILQCDDLSLNWFCLAYRYITPQLEQYQRQICANTRSLLAKIPKTLQNRAARYRVVPMAPEIDPAFIDIKIAGPFQQIKAAALILPYLFVSSMKKNQPIFNRPSLGFYHPNISVIFGKECSTVRLTLGLDPAEVPIFAKCFERIATL